MHRQFVWPVPHISAVRLCVAWQAELYRPQDLRRGHYMDLKAQGRALWEILEAAGVTDPKAPRPYFNMDELEFDACMQCHLQSDDDE